MAKVPGIMYMSKTWQCCMKYSSFDREELTSGERGIYFSENGSHTWRELAEGLADTLFTLRVSETEKVKSISLDEAAHKWAGGSKLLAELGFVSKYMILVSFIKYADADVSLLARERDPRSAGAWVGSLAKRRQTSPIISKLRWKRFCKNIRLQHPRTSRGGIFAIDDFELATVGHVYGTLYWYARDNREENMMF
jgi:hypothetical protein